MSHKYNARKGSLFINSIWKTVCYVQMNQTGLLSHNIYKK